MYMIATTAQDCLYLQLKTALLSFEREMEIGMADWDLRIV
jgi:hypothetical protein